MPTAWRIVKAQHAGNPFDGEGARIHGGRWNSPGTSMVYMSESKSLAAMEILVQLQDSGPLHAYLAIPAVFDANQLLDVTAIAQLTKTWDASPAPQAIRKIGDRWVKSEASLVLRVPSAVVGGEWNYLLNPAHEDFSSLQRGKAEEFSWDTRLFGKDK